MPPSPLPPLPPGDLDHVLAHAGDALRQLAGERVFMTGGTGFFGAWLTESLLWANARLGVGARLVVLSRDPAAFRARMPHVADDPALELWQGDVTRLQPPPGRFAFVVHAATEPQTSALAPSAQLALNVEATRRVLELAAGAGTARMLFTSSGAVYGAQPPELSHVPEDYAGAPDEAAPGSAYGLSKRASEQLCVRASSDQGLSVAIARCFAFVGPHLPLGANFAVGNFLRDALAGGPIVVRGDGTPLRSYLYAADLAIWLWTILLRGRPARAYNVGSEDAVSIAELAQRVAAAAGGACAVRVERTPVPGAAPARYVPSTARAASELGLRATIALPDALARHLAWLRGRAAPVSRRS